MRKTVILLVLLIAAAALLAGCNKKSNTPSAGPSSASAPADATQQKMQELAGNGATDCGRFKSQAAEQMKAASDCAMKAAQTKHAFYVAYDLPGLTVGVAGTGEGKLFAVQTQQSEQPGAVAQVQSAPCPAELRVAQSGRITCTLPGSMGMNMGGGGSPHGGGMPAAPGTENPHAGGMPMTAPPAGTPNPHGAIGKKPPK